MHVLMLTAQSICIGSNTRRVLCLSQQWTWLCWWFDQFWSINIFKVKHSLTNVPLSDKCPSAILPSIRFIILYLQKEKKYLKNRRRQKGRKKRRKKEEDRQYQSWVTQTAKLLCTKTTVTARANAKSCDQRSVPHHWFHQLLWRRSVR